MKAWPHDAARIKKLKNKDYEKACSYRFLINFCFLPCAE